MKAARIEEYGNPSVIHIAEIDTPEPNESQVQVQVYAASLNPFDTTVREGYMRDSIPLNFPLTLGGDIAGVVTKVGQEVKDISVGDKIYGQANVVAGNSGAFAEFAVTAAGQVSKMPLNVDFLTAASLPLVGVSALQALTEHLEVQAGQKLFIHGGGGGIGSIAIQIAKHLGAYVATTATGKDIERVKQRGADEVIDYKTSHFTDLLKEYDAVFDTVGGNDFLSSFAILKPGGIAVSMIVTADEAAATAAGIRAMMQFTKVTSDRLHRLKSLVESGIIEPNIGEVYSLDQVAAAFVAREGGTVAGKIVIQIIEE